MYLWYLTGLAGKDALADAVLGGASDYMSDIGTNLIKIYYAKDDEKVNLCKFLVTGCRFRLLYS